MQLPGYPEDVSTVESIFVWAATALDNKKYPAVILNDSITGTPPISLRTGRITASAKFNEPYLRVTADIPLDSEALHVSPLYLATQELVAGDTMPTALTDNLGTLGSGTPASEPLYTLDEISANIVFWTRGESMTKTGFGVVSFGDVNDSQTAIGQGSNNYIGLHNGQPGLIYASDNAPDAPVTGLSITEYSVIFGAAYSQGQSYVEVCRNVGWNASVFLGPSSSVDIGGTSHTFSDLTLDDAIHVFHLVVGASAVTLYLDGVLQETLNHGETLSETSLDYIFGDFDSYGFASDLVIVNKAMSGAEVASTYTAIATHRGLV